MPLKPQKVKCEQMLAKSFQEHGRMRTGTRGREADTKA